MNFKTTLVLLVLVVIGGLVWYLAGEAPPPTGEEETAPGTTEPRYVLDPRPEANDIVRVEFQRRDEPKLVFERSPNKDDPDRMEDWRMIEPLVSATENYVVNGLVTMLTGLQSRRSVKPETADAGLDPPAATLTLVDKEGNKYGAEIGKRLALSNDMYVRVVGRDEIVVVGRDLTRDIEREVSEYRAKSIIKLARADAKHVHIEHEGTTYDFTRSAEDEWVINQPVKAYARAEAVKSLANALGSVRVKEFIDDAPQSLDRYGLEPPALTITVTTEKKELVAEQPEAEEGEEPSTQPIEPRFELVTETHSLAVGDHADFKAETRYIKLPDEPWVATAIDTQLDKLIPKLNDIRDPKVTRVKADDVTRLEITSGTSTVTLEKKDGKWTGTGDLAQLEAAAVKKVLTAFEDVSAIDYVDDPADLARYGLDQPRAVLTATTAGAVEPVALHIGADTPSGRNTHVQVAGQPSVIVISAERARGLAVAPLTLRSRVITSGKPDQVKAVTLQRGEKRYVLEREEDSHKWQMLEPADAPPDPTTVRELVNDLSRLRAREVVAKGEYVAYGLTEPALTVHFAMERPAEAPPPDAQPATPESQPITGETPMPPPAMQPTTEPATQPAPPAVERVEHTLVVGRAAGKTYARLDDVPYVFELDETVYRVLTQELIRRGLFDVEADDVTHLKIEAPGGTVEFAREDDEWVYPPDKYVELSQKRVGDFVKELAELRVNAFIAYRDGDLARYGLEDAPVTVTMRLEDESVITLKIDQLRRGELPRKAAWVEQQRVFLLREAEAEKLMRGLDHYVKSEGADTPESEPD